MLLLLEVVAVVLVTTLAVMVDLAVAVVMEVLVVDLVQVDKDIMEVMRLVWTLII